MGPAGIASVTVGSSDPQSRLAAPCSPRDVCQSVSRESWLERGAQTETLGAVRAIAGLEGVDAVVNEILRM